MQSDQPNQQIENWLPLESNSDILNNYMTILGINHSFARFYDIVSFDEQSLLYIPPPIVAALFVFPDSKFINNYFFEKGDSFFEKKPPQSLYYMKQIAENACGTISMLHCLINLLQEFPFIFEEDSFISSFYTDSLHMTPEQRAEYLTTCKKTIKKKDGEKSLQEAHKDAAKEGAEEIDLKLQPKHHFISFVWKDGCVWELDGRKKGPINYAECTQENFMKTVFNICIENYVSKDQAEIGFNLMALSLGGSE